MEAVLQQKLSTPDTLGQIKVSKDPIYRSVLISENLNIEVSEMSALSQCNRFRLHHSNYTCMLLLLYCI